MTLPGRGAGYGGEVRQGGISVDPALVCRGKAVATITETMCGLTQHLKVLELSMHRHRQHI